MFVDRDFRINCKIAGVPSQNIELSLNEIRRTLKCEGLTEDEKFSNLTNSYFVISEAELKASPDVNAETLISIKKEDIVEFMSAAYEDRSNKSIWWKVKFNQYEGWCLAKCLQKTDAKDSCGVRD